jgi:molybdate transport system substrate-binding protein
MTSADHIARKAKIPSASTSARPSGFARQIEEGAPADLFFSADLAQMDSLEKKNLARARARGNIAVESVGDHRAGGFEALQFVTQRLVKA